MLAGRTLGLFLGIFSLVATEVGGAFVNGTAEEVYNKGLLWCIAPVGYSLRYEIPLTLALVSFIEPLLPV